MCIRDRTVEEQLARWPLYLPFLMLVLLLTGIGLIMVFSASYASAYYNEAVTHHDPTWYVKRQAIFAAAGVVVMYPVSYTQLDVYKRQLSSYENYIDAIAGGDLHLTIDNTIQSYAQRVMDAGIAKYDVQEGAFCIVMDLSLIHI